jgi:hypothetical protein
VRHFCDSRRVATDITRTFSGEDRNRTSGKTSEKSRPSRTSGADYGAVAENPAKTRDNDQSTDDPDLATIIAAWSTLPPAIRAGVIALIRAAGGRHK